MLETTNKQDWQERKKRLTHYTKYMSDEELRLLLEWANTKTPPVQLAFLIMSIMGLRVGEVVNLKINNIKGNKLVFKLEKTENKIHTRIIPYYLQDILNQYIETYKDYFIDGFLLTPRIGGNRHGSYIKKAPPGSTHIKPSTLALELHKFREQYNLNDVYAYRSNGQKMYRISLHTIRHNFLYRLYQTTDKDLLLTADIIGHSNIKITAGYLRGIDRINKESNIINKMAVI